MFIGLKMLIIHMSAMTWPYKTFSSIQYNKIRGPPILVRILVKFSLGEMGGLLVKSKKSWRNQKYLGEIDGLLVKWVDSWWNQKDLGEIIFRQDKTNISVCLKERWSIALSLHVVCILWAQVIKLWESHELCDII